MGLNRRTLLAGLGAQCLCSQAAIASTFGDGLRPLCGLNVAYPSFDRTSALAAPAPEAVQAVKLLTDVVGIEANFEVVEGTFVKKVLAFAAVRQNQRYIVYDKDEFWFESGRTNWISVGILAHEVGHHLAAHTYVSGASNHARELEADRFAGMALGRLGATIDQARAWAIGLSEAGSKTHPPRADRLVAIREGWDLAKARIRVERGRCTPGWEGDGFALDHRQCRIARTCEGETARSRLFCQDYQGIWQPQGQ